MEYKVKRTTKKVMVSDGRKLIERTVYLTEDGREVAKYNGKYYYLEKHPFNYEFSIWYLGLTTKEMYGIK